MTYTVCTHIVRDIPSNVYGCSLYTFQGKSICGQLMISSYKVFNGTYFMYCCFYGALISLHLQAGSAETEVSRNFDNS